MRQKEVHSCSQKVVVSMMVAILVLFTSCQVSGDIVQSKVEDTFQPWQKASLRVYSSNVAQPPYGLAHLFVFLPGHGTKTIEEYEFQILEQKTKNEWLVVRDFQRISSMRAFPADSNIPITQKQEVYLDSVTLQHAGITRLKILVRPVNGQGEFSLPEASVSSTVVYAPLMDAEEEIEGIQPILTYYPYRLTFRAGETINLYVHLPSNYNRESYFYTLGGQQQEGSWFSLAEYASIPDEFQATGNSQIGAYKIGSYTFSPSDEPAVFWLVIFNADGEEIFSQGIWGFMVHDFDETPNRVHLLRDILNQYMDTNSLHEQYRALGTDLAISALYLYNHANGNIKVLQQALEGLPEAKNIYIRDKYLMIEAGKFSRLQGVNLETGELLYASGRIPLLDYRSFDTILSTLVGLPEELIVAGLINHSLYNNYDYATPPEKYLVQDLRENYAHCGIYAEDMYFLLDAAGYRVRMRSAEGNLVGVHALVEVLIDDNWYSLDPTANVIYEAGVDDLGTTNPIYYELPQIRNLSTLIGPKYWEQTTITYLIRDNE